MVEILPVSSFLDKTHVSTNGLEAMRPITLSSLPESQEEGMGDGDQLLCPVCTLEAYMKRSLEYRSADQERLIIFYRRGTVRDISKQTIYGYIKKAILLAFSCASQANIFSPVHVKPHSVRHVATSLSAERNFSLDDVLRAGA